MWPISQQSGHIVILPVSPFSERVSDISQPVQESSDMRLFIKSCARLGFRKAEPDLALWLKPASRRTQGTAVWKQSVNTPPWHAWCLIFLWRSNASHGVTCIDFCGGFSQAPKKENNFPLWKHFVKIKGGQGSGKSEDNFNFMLVAYIVDVNQAHLINTALATPSPKKEKQPNKP